MPCLSTFCCGYSLRGGGSFIGYFSILIYVKLLVLCIVFLWCIKLRIDKSEGIPNWGLLGRVSNYLQPRVSVNNDHENSLDDLRVYSIIIIVYILFLLLGILSASFLITGAKLRQPGKLWWWLVYQGFFIVLTAGMIVIFIQMEDEKYGLLSYLKNYLFRFLVSIFVVIYAGFVALLIYFWTNILSLHSELKKTKLKKHRQLINESQTQLTENQLAAASSSIRLVPLELGSSNLADTERGGKYFILHV